MVDGSKPLANERHEIFAQAVACKGLTAAEAYAAAGYNRGVNAQRNSYRVTSNPAVKARIAYLQGKAADKAAMDKAWVLRKLGEVFEKAFSGDQLAAANRALELIGKDQGMFVERQAGADGGPIVHEVRHVIVDPQSADR